MFATGLFGVHGSVPTDAVFLDRGGKVGLVIFVFLLPPLSAGTLFLAVAAVAVVIVEGLGGSFLWPPAPTWIPASSPTTAIGTIHVGRRSEGSKFFNVLLISQVMV